MTAKAALLIRVLRVDEHAKMMLVNVDLLSVRADGSVNYSGRTQWLSFGGSNWESASQSLHKRLSGFLDDRVKACFDPDLEAFGQRHQIVDA
jgi:hypothetical protein